jgi:hypothetical protein
MLRCHSSAVTTFQRRRPVKHRGVVAHATAITGRGACHRQHKQYFLPHASGVWHMPPTSVSGSCCRSEVCCSCHTRIVLCKCSPSHGSGTCCNPHVWAACSRVGNGSGPCHTCRAARCGQVWAPCRGGAVRGAGWGFGQGQVGPPRAIPAANMPSQSTRRNRADFQIWVERVSWLRSQSAVRRAAERLPVSRREIVSPMLRCHSSTVAPFQRRRPIKRLVFVAHATAITRRGACHRQHSLWFLPHQQGQWRMPPTSVGESCC